MTKVYYMDLRECIISACDSGSSAAAVSMSFAVRLKRQRRECGTLEPKPHRGGREALTTLMAA